ncbi:hypothetical protein QQZ08_007085 [Neonectria magnoliae]|uniref:Heterokaryon incompatibility domain-containing protein n=1 Tax=Neonectria magnoliae TaxID=2732573 RepID=A0ABR1HYY7_9HYPO
MPSEQMRNLTVTRWEDEFINDVAQARIREALDSDKSVLVFCDQCETGSLSQLVDPEKNQGYIHVKRDEVAHCLLPCRRHTAESGGKNKDDGIGPSVFAVTDLSRVPVAIQTLGLVVVCGLQERILLDKQTSHLVETLVDRSEAEMEAAIAHAHLSDQEDVSILTNAPLSPTRPKTPPRRIENDQIESFVFELLQVCKEIRFPHLLNCFILDIHAVGETVIRLGTNKWIERSPSPVGRGLFTASTAEARRLARLLPLFEYNFPPAAFLADFEDPTSRATVAAVRIAAITHFRLELVMPEFDIEQAADRKGMSPGELFVKIWRKLGPTCGLPPRYLEQGSIWIDLAAWHTGAIYRQNYATLPDERVNKGTLLFDIMSKELSQELLVDVVACRMIRQLVQRLDSVFDIPAHGPPSRLVLSQPDIDCIHDNLLRAWAYQTMFLYMEDCDQGVRKAYVDIVAGSNVSVKKPHRDRLVETVIPNGPEMPWEGMFLVATGILRNETPHGAEFGPSGLVVIPVSAIHRWERAHYNASFYRAIQTRYPLVD